MAAKDHAGMQLKDRPEFSNKPKPLTVTRDVSVKEAVGAMCEQNFGSIIVVDGDEKVIGIMTERDVMRKLVNEGRDDRVAFRSPRFRVIRKAAKVDDRAVDE